MQVEVRFYGFVRDIIGTAPFAFETPQSTTLRNLLEILVKKYGERLRERILTRTGELETNIKIFAGESQVASLEEPLGDGQTSLAKVKIFVLSATAGG